MSRRSQIEMSAGEAREFLLRQKTIILVSNGPGGFPHPMPMWFALDPDGSVRMTTYAKSQKVRNLERDPRCTLLVEEGLDYAKLRGVVIFGHAEIVHDQGLILDTMMRASRGPGEAAPDPSRLGDAARQAMMKTAQKRVCIRVAPGRTVSWDHGKLGGVY
jgi:PPOX class probable F420-dependent enzyme